MKPTPIVYWAVSTAVAAVMLISYVHGFVYTRTEGEKLERRVEAIQSQYREDLQILNQKIDEIYKLLVAGKESR